MSALWAALVTLALGTAAESVSRGTPASGSLENGVSFPARGAGFVTYSRLGYLLGRQYVHSRVRDALVATFASLQAAQPRRVFVLGETGLAKGGPFPPHRTHQNGLSVDVFMPVRDRNGQPAPMPTAPWNKFGYALEFDARGRGDQLDVDFPSVAELLVELDRQASRHGLAIERVIVAPEYVPRVLSSGAGGIEKLSSRMMRTPAWVRHDEHVHVDFRLAAQGRAR
jgi:penicillin-insensitive murein endopeptidase